MKFVKPEQLSKEPQPDQMTRKSVEDSSAFSNPLIQLAYGVNGPLVVTARKNRVGTLAAGAVKYVKRPLPSAVDVPSVVQTGLTTVGEHWIW